MRRMEVNKTMHELNLHESLQTNGFLITRVPGGWIYSRYGHQGEIRFDRPKAGSPVFVPYNVEFS